MISKEEIKFILNFIGAKFDELKAVFGKEQTIKIDIGEASLAFKDAAIKMTALAEDLASREEKKDEATGAIVRGETHTLMMIRTLNENANILKKIADKKNIDLSDLRIPLTAIGIALKDLKKTETAEKLDLTPLTRMERTMTSVLKEMEKNKNRETNELLSLIWKKLSKMEIKIPPTFKLDDMQLRQLSNARGGGGGVSIGATGNPTNGVVYDGRKEVAVTNTAVKLAADQLCEQVFITALDDNADVVVIGGPGVVFTQASRTGRSLNPGDSITLTVRNLNKIYVNGTADDGVAFAFTA